MDDELTELTDYQMNDSVYNMYVLQALFAAFLSSFSFPVTPGGSLY